MDWLKRALVKWLLGDFITKVDNFAMDASNEVKHLDTRIELQKLDIEELQQVVKALLDYHKLKVRSEYRLDASVADFGGSGSTIDTANIAATMKVHVRKPLKVFVVSPREKEEPKRKLRVKSK